MKGYFWLTLLLYLPLHAHSQELKLCGVEWPPFTYAENGMISGGISYDIIEEAFKRLGATFIADEVPWPRCLMYVKNGKYDAVIDGSSVSPYITGIHPTAKYELGVYVINDHKKKVFTWDSLKGKRVGVVRGYDYTESISSYTGWIKDYATTDELALRKLKGGRYDYVVLDTYSADILAKKVGASIRMLHPPIDSTDLFLAFNQTNTKQLKSFDMVIGEMIQDGTIDQIYQRYIDHSYTELFLQQP